MTPRERAEATVRGMWGALPSVLVAHIEQSIESALAEQAAGEAERVREAVAREREACARVADRWSATTAGMVIAEDIRARATSPAPVASAERAVVEAAIDWRAFVRAPEWRERALFAAVDALAAARKDGAR